MKNSSNKPGPPPLPNTFVNALGVLPDSISELVRRMTPSTQPPGIEMRSRGVMDRFAAVGELEDVYVPTSRDVKLALRIYRMMVRGYHHRPPSAAYWRNHQKEANALAYELDAPGAGQITANTTSVLGTSGMGKTTGVSMALNLLPPVVLHDQGKNPLLPKTQIPALTVTCPVNRTPKAFIIEYFRQVELLTGIDYSHCTARGRSDDAMIVEMGRVTRLHCIGLLVFDEVQQVVGGDDRLKHLLVRLTNTIKVPILFVGTFKSQSKLVRELATARRLLGEPWIPFTATDEDWERILSDIWGYQVTRTPTPLDDELKKCMFELTCGIPAIAKSLYGFVQEHLIINAADADPEKITPDILKQLFETEMSSVAPAMKALRSGDSQSLNLLDDLLPPKLPTPDSWRADAVLEDTAKLAFTDSVIRTARRAGKERAIELIGEDAK